MKPSAASVATNSSRAAATVAGLPTKDCRARGLDDRLTDRQALGLRKRPPLPGHPDRIGDPHPPLDQGRLGIGVDVRQRSVGVVAGQVAAPDLLQGEDRVLRGDLQAADLTGAFLCLGVGVAEDVRHPGHDLQIAGLPPVPGEPALTSA